MATRRKAVRKSGAKKKRKYTRRAAPRSPRVDPRSIREITLDTAKKLVVSERNAAYGNPEDNFGHIAGMFNIYQSAKPSHPALTGFAAITTHDVAVFMILTKVARIAQSPAKQDHWDDLAGYAACGAECAMKDEAE
jgi:hypothetical protein